MKKLKFCVLAVMLAVCFTLSAQNADQIFEKYSKEKNVLLQNVDKSIFSEEDLEDIKKFIPDARIDSMRVLVFEKCEEDIKKRFRSDVVALKDEDNYKVEIFVTVAETIVKIMSRNVEDKKDKMYIFVTIANNSPVGVLVEIYGLIGQINADALNIENGSVNLK